MILLLLGAPGSGKGTQCKILSQKYGLVHLATGDILRAEIAAKTPSGVKAQEYVKNGRLVPDALVTEMVASQLKADGGKYLLDGFPRNIEQAKSLAKMLSSQGNSIGLVVYLNLSNAEAIKRLTSRRVCSKCGEVFNLVTRPPASEGRCDACGGDLLQREDDAEPTAKKRLMVYEDLTQPLVAYYKVEQTFHEIDAAQPIDKVSKDLSAVVESSLAAR